MSDELSRTTQAPLSVAGDITSKVIEIVDKLPQGQGDIPPRGMPKAVADSICRDSAAESPDFGTNLSRALLATVRRDSSGGFIEENLEAIGEARRAAGAPRRLDGLDYPSALRLGNILTALGCIEGADRFADARTVYRYTIEISRSNSERAVATNNLALAYGWQSLWHQDVRGKGAVAPWDFLSRKNIENLRLAAELHGADSQDGNQTRHNIANNLRWRGVRLGIEQIIEEGIHAFEAVRSWKKEDPGREGAFKKLDWHIERAQRNLLEIGERSEPIRVSSRATAIVPPAFERRIAEIVKALDPQGMSASIRDCLELSLTVGGREELVGLVGEYRYAFSCSALLEFGDIVTALACSSNAQLFGIGREVYRLAAGRAFDGRELDCAHARVELSFLLGAAWGLFHDIPIAKMIDAMRWGGREVDRERSAALANPEKRSEVDSYPDTVLLNDGGVGTTRNPTRKSDANSGVEPITDEKRAVKTDVDAGGAFAGAVAAARARMVDRATDAEIAEVSALLMTAKAGVEKSEREAFVVAIREMLDSKLLDIFETGGGKKLTLTIKNGQVYLQGGGTSRTISEVDFVVHPRELPSFSKRPSRSSTASSSHSPA